MKYVFTIHAEKRLHERKITKREVTEVIEYPDKHKKRHGKHYSHKNIGLGIIEVVYEKTENNIKIITVYWL